MSIEEKIIYLRTKICIDYSNTAWLRATDYKLPLDNQYCGKKLWSLWYNPNALSLTSLARNNNNSPEVLQQYIELDNQLKEAFTESVNNGRKMLKQNQEVFQSNSFKTRILELLSRLKK